MVLPDNVLFESGQGRDIRCDLMDKCELHTILRLPTGIFYAQGVKTNVLFFTKKNDAAKGATERVWIYGLRANMPQFGKRTALTLDHFAEFVEAYGADHSGPSPRTDQGETGRFRCFTREDIVTRHCCLFDWGRACLAEFGKVALTLTHAPASHRQWGCLAVSQKLPQIKGYPYG